MVCNELRQTRWRGRQKRRKRVRTRSVKHGRIDVPKYLKCRIRGARRKVGREHVQPIEFPRQLGNGYETYLRCHTNPPLGSPPQNTHILVKSS